MTGGRLKMLACCAAARPLSADDAAAAEDWALAAAPACWAEADACWACAVAAADWAWAAAAAAAVPIGAGADGTPPGRISVSLPHGTETVWARDPDVLVTCMGRHPPTCGSACASPEWGASSIAAL